MTKSIYPSLYYIFMMSKWLCMSCNSIINSDTRPDVCPECGIPSPEAFVPFDDMQNNEDTKRKRPTKKREVRELDADETGNYDPEDEFRQMLRDMGLKTKIKTITEVFFQGNTDSPDWLEYVLKKANIPQSKRELILMRWFGDKYEKMMKASEDDESDEDVESDEIDEDTIKKEMRKIRLKRLRELKEMYEEKRLEAELKRLEQFLSQERSPSNRSDDSELIELPLTKPDGEPVLDANGMPVIVKVTPQQAMALSMRSEFSQRHPKDEAKNDGFAQIMTAIMTMMMEMNKQQMQLALESRKEMADMLKLLVESKGRGADDTTMRRIDELTTNQMKLIQEIYQQNMERMYDVIESMQNAPSVAKKLKEDLELFRSLGIVGGSNIDYKTEKQAEVANKLIDTLDNTRSDLMSIAREVIIEERRKALESGNAEEKKKPLSDEEIDRFYREEISTVTNAEPETVENTMSVYESALQPDEIAAPSSPESASVGEKTSRKRRKKK